MTFHQKLFLGFGLMVIPVLLVGAEAIRSNALERRALESLGQSLTRTRTYSEVETAMFNQSEVIWRVLSGLDPQAREEFRLQGEVVDYWFDRWSAELQPDERELSDGVRQIEQQVRAVADSVFRLQDVGQRAEAYALARRELKERLLPALTEMNHRIYRRAREFSVSRAFARVEEIVNTERGILSWIFVLSLLAGLSGAWLIARSLSRPIAELREAMAVVGRGDLDHPITPRSSDEIGDLARSFQQMTENLRASRAELTELNGQLEGKIAQLERTQAQLVESEKLASVGQMAAGVAHGLRNPLASLRASAQLALRHPDSPSAREALGSMISEVDRLDQRITHLLTFSRPSPLRATQENIGALVSGLVPALRRLADAGRVDLRTDIQAELPDVAIDPLSTEQALQEVVANALDAMPDGGTLAISVRSLDDGGRVQVEVRDSGRGISADALPRIFDPFFTTRPEGTGLGLAIARRFIEQGGGTIEVESRSGAGTTVRIGFPAAAPAPTGSPT
jgi:signal transduction histidine kinase